ncbi:MAG TPA: PilZ domain-containing protein [Myxococcota bacterium]|nr:PilZ domain-containing protein [Myxococcota bacterium]
MSRKAAPLILSLAPPESYAPLARITLSRSGYSIVSGERWAEMSQSVENAPRLAIADLECDGVGIPPATPWIALAPRGAPHPTRATIVGLVERPAPFHTLYRVLQLALEPTPRASARVATNLAAHCRGDKGNWDAQVVSLSRDGCLLWREEPPPGAGEQVTLDFDLGTFGRVELSGRTVYRRVSETALVFSDVSAPEGRSIQRFVEEKLLTR